MSEPTLPEVFQSEPVQELLADRPIAVVIEGPVRTQSLPSVIGTAKTVELPADGTAVMVGNQAYNRKRLLLLASDEPFVVGIDKGQVEQNFSPTWPVDVVLEWQARDQVWAKRGTAATITTLVVIEDFWAE